MSIQTVAILPVMVDRRLQITEVVFSIARGIVGPNQHSTIARHPDGHHRD